MIFCIARLNTSHNWLLAWQSAWHCLTFVPNQLQKHSKRLSSTTIISIVPMWILSHWNCIPTLLKSHRLMRCSIQICWNSYSMILKSSLPPSRTSAAEDRLLLLSKWFRRKLSQFMLCFKLHIWLDEWCCFSNLHDNRRFFYLWKWPSLSLLCTSDCLLSFQCRSSWCSLQNFHWARDRPTISWLQDFRTSDAKVHG